MAPTAYTGALQPKKKSELQEIAVALRLSDQGTKDELQARIKKHLDSNQDALEDDPTFAGLFGRRKRSLQPQPIPQSGRFAPSSSTPDTIEKPRSSLGRASRVLPLDPIKEATPPKDLRDVSTFLKHPFSPAETTPAKSPRQIDLTTPSSLPPLPPSPAKSIIERLPKASEVKATLETKQEEALQNGYEMITSLRLFLSNSRNIWSLTAVFELLYIISTIIPWKSISVPVVPVAGTGPTLTVFYPPLSVFQTSAFWLVLLHWALPTLIVPTLAGYIISFNPTTSPSPSRSSSPSHLSLSPNNKPTPPALPLDPLTAGIIRVALQTAYPYPTIAARAGVVGLDVLGKQWRLVSASVGLAFAFSEAIAGAPKVALDGAQRQQQRLAIEQRQREATPVRGVLMDREEEENEVD
ncbi:hypothetical protein JR316_0010945 [Psilocybe cubensis]|uniref:Uncharacterized protein n=2 Tax=Psilocybe cubensis TaxID=181762 RepID=A0ACB8GNI9_PSICU|nr:hypothetical protein JR316_0010945 [Psilocybe cubensis]KAH9477029.1 hypothetical protein JR316_0010945 [Psilocybe cubensis]